MKTVTICCLMSLLCLNASGQKQKLNLQGVWKLVAFDEVVKGKPDHAYPGYATIDETKTGRETMSCL